MEQKIPDYCKVFNVINSCQTLHQLQVAEVYLDLFLRRNNISENSVHWKYVQVLKLHFKKKFKTLTCTACTQI